MHCRNCSKEVDEKAYVCVHCGVMPKKEKKFCHQCGVAIQVNQDACIKCGVSLNDSGFSVDFSKKNRLAAGVLAIVLGGLGIHKFYLGYNKEGVITLLIFILGLIFFGLPSFVIAVITIIEGITYLTKTDEDFKNSYIDKKTPWF